MKCNLNSLHVLVISMDADFFQINFQKILSGIPSECQIVWIHIRPDILSGLIWIQTVCEGLKQKLAPAGK